MAKFNKIMLVDDDEVMNFLSGEILRNMDIVDNIEVADDGSVAMDMITEKTCPDIIFLDIRMPRMDGFDFLNCMKDKELCGKTKVVMLTSSSRPEDKNKAMSYSCVVDYFEKPLTDEMVMKVAKKYLA